MKKQNILLSIIVFATLTRVAIPPLFGHLPNFSALDALALFCGAYCERRMVAIAMTLASVWVGDMLLTHTMFYEGFYWQYGSYALITLLGTTISTRSLATFFVSRKRGFVESQSPDEIKKQISSGLRVPFMALTSAILFFVMTNFGVWFSGTLYPQTLDGLVACYVAAIPFFKQTLVSDLVFSGVLFGAMGWLGYVPAHKQRVRVT